MSNLKAFKQQPTSQANYQSGYRNSYFSLPASPEYSTGEVCLASLIRALGSNVEESEVYLRNSLEGSSIRISLESSWDKFSDEFNLQDNVFKYLKSPLAGQSPKNPSEYLNLYPLIPQFSFVSNSARFVGNPWNPSEFVKGMIASGSLNGEEASFLWKTLYDCISITGEDDLWARLMNSMFSLADLDSKFHWTGQDFDPKGNELFTKFSVDKEIISQFQFPAKTFCKTLHDVISLKKLTTRRQWVSMFESFLRITMGTHLLWLCNLNIRLWKLLWEEFDVSGSKYTKDQVVTSLFKDFNSLVIDTTSDQVFRRISGDYAEARIGINLFIHYFDETHGIKLENGIGDINSLMTWLNAIRRISSSHERKLLKDTLLELLGRNPRIQQGSASFSKNIFEFLKHSLGQKATTDPQERNFDQGYWIIKKGKARNAPWVVKFGPVAVITLVALSIKSKVGTATDLTSFLSALGIAINPDKILTSSLGGSLVDLGLTNDNPDGEKGIVILNPFYQE